VDVDVSRAAIEQLLEYFASDALGLILGARIQDASDLTARHRGFLTDPESKLRVWVAWHTDKGPVSTCATYDREQALRMSAHVLRIAWCIAPRDHHEGWWHCFPKRPREWIKGCGIHRDAPS
jgi:hypothetical protein